MGFFSLEKVFGESFRIQKITKSKKSWRLTLVHSLKNRWILFLFPFEILFKFHRKKSYRKNYWQIRWVTCKSSDHYFYWLLLVLLTICSLALGMWWVRRGKSYKWFSRGLPNPGLNYSDLICACELPGSFQF